MMEQVHTGRVFKQRCMLASGWQRFLPNLPAAASAWNNGAPLTSVVLTDRLMR